VPTPRPTLPCSSPWQRAAHGKSDPLALRLLNVRPSIVSTGNRGHNPFYEDTVRTILANRIFLPGSSSLTARPVDRRAHAPILDMTSSTRLQQVRAAHRTRSSQSARTDASVTRSQGWPSVVIVFPLHFRTAVTRSRASFCYQGKQRRQLSAPSIGLKLAPSRASWGYLATFLLDDETAPQSSALYEISREP